MAQKIDFKVSYVSVSEDGLERHNDVMLSSISADEKKDIKSLTFLPIHAGSRWNITSLLKGFPILESVYLPSMMTTTIKDLQKECPMINTLLILSHGITNNSFDQIVVKVDAHEEEGDNYASFRTFVSSDKDNRSTFIVNSKQVQNHELVDEVKHVVRLMPTHVEEYLTGERGIVAVLDSVNEAIEDERFKLDISEDTLRALLTIFVEKGVTFEEFTIDFSKLYDKIESYKSIAKSVNQVSIKEEIETSIIESYQNVLKKHYEGLLKEKSNTMSKLILGTTIDTENMLYEDLSTDIARIVVDSPSFDEDYRESSEMDTILSDLPMSIARSAKTSKERSLLRKYLSAVVSNLKSNKEVLFEKIDSLLEERINIELAQDMFAKKFNLDLTRKPQKKLADSFVEILTTKNLGSLTKEDVSGIIATTFKEMENGEIRSGELVKIITKVVDDFPTKEEIRNVLVDFVAKNGYVAIRPTNA